MKANIGDTSVFTDDTGARKRWLTLVIRGAAGLIGLSAVAVAVSVFGHVSLPGLDAPLRLPGVAHSPSTQGNKAELSQNSTVGQSDSKSNNKPSTQESSGMPLSPGTTHPTPTSTPTVTGKPTAKPTTAVDPPRGRPTEPPGKAKNLKPAL